LPYDRSRRVARPLDKPTLEALAIHYLGRYATTRTRLAGYLARKIRTLGWSGEEDGVALEAIVSAIVERCAESGYVDDRAFAEARSASLLRRGYGQGRVRTALRTAGVHSDIVNDLTPVDEEAKSAAERFARRRRFGRFGEPVFDQAVRQKQFAAMVRAGHSYEFARYFTSPAEKEHSFAPSDAD